MRAAFSVRTGVYVWGACLVVWLALLVGALIVYPALSQPGSTPWLERVSRSLQEHNTLSASLTGTLGVVWSWFLQLHLKASGKID